MENIIQARLRHHRVYAHNDEMALGAIQALKSAGMKPGFDVMVSTRKPRSRRLSAASLV